MLQQRHICQYISRGIDDITDDGPPKVGEVSTYLERLLKHMKQRHLDLPAKDTKLLYSFYGTFNVDVSLRYPATLGDFAGSQLCPLGAQECRNMQL